jgi:hypothetical protein
MAQIAILAVILSERFIMEVMMNYSVRTPIFIFAVMLFCGIRAADNVKSENNNIVSNNTPPANPVELKKSDPNHQPLPQTAIPEPLWLQTVATESKAIDAIVLFALARKIGRAAVQKETSFLEKMHITCLASVALLRSNSILKTGQSLFNSSQGLGTQWCEAVAARPVPVLLASVAAVTGACVIVNYALDCMDSVWKKLKKNSRIGFILQVCC